MIFRLSNIKETTFQDPKNGKEITGFVSEFALDTNLPENQEFIASVFQVLTKARPDYLVGRRYVITPELKPKNTLGTKVPKIKKG